MKIEHLHDDCPGSWHLATSRIVCDSCGRALPATPENRMAAVDENCLGSLLRLSARRGSRLLGEDEG